MRFMMIVKPPDHNYDGPPNREELEAMGRYNKELERAGVLLELNGLAPPREGAKVKFHGNKRTVVDGPFSEAKEVIGGYSSRSGRRKRHSSGPGGSRSAPRYIRARRSKSRCAESWSRSTSLDGCRSGGAMRPRSLRTHRASFTRLPITWLKRLRSPASSGPT